MYFSDKVKLLRMRSLTDDDGYLVEDPSPEVKEVFADCHSVARSEFWSAGQNGIEATLSIRVHVEDYGGQMDLEYDGKRYEVVRAYKVERDYVELTCKDKGV